MSTPLMQQYHQVKTRYPDTILLFRMGDFFETFEEDAKTTSRVLGITLTRRGAGSSGEVPLAGFRVAVCEQIEDPKVAQGIVKRDVIEVVTPGVAFSDKVLEQKQNNYLVSIALPSAIAASGETIGFSYVDISTGEFGVTEVTLRELADQIISFTPAEILVQKRDKDTLQRLLASTSTHAIYTTIDDWVLQYDYGYETLLRHFKTQSLKGFGIDSMTLGVMAAGAVMHYLNETQKSNLSHIQKILPFSTSDAIVLDVATKRNLEITSSFGGTSEGTLFSVIDRTNTPMGARLLKRWISQPLKDLSRINWRLDGVSCLVALASVREELIGQLSEIGDMERLIAKIATGRANPREMLALKSILERLPVLKQVIASAAVKPHAALEGKLSTLSEIASELSIVDGLVEAIGCAIADDPPAKLDDGGIIRAGYNAELDEIRRLSHSGKEWIANLQKQERERTGIASLKIGFNNVFGYYIEITHTNKEKVPPEYIRKQTMTNAERFITPELKEYEDKVLNAEERILALETMLFNELRARAASHAAEIQHNARWIATLDCITSLASTAEEHNYTRPHVDDTALLEIEDGRHPVIETLLPVGETYIPNSVALDTSNEQVLIITGPNMSGKSSFLRQVGLIVLLAQAGSFVPAKKAVIGMVDNIFTRVGASDNISSGESTFLVEMHEAANIVNRATRKSLILLDEVGRGTSTFDGISIAWALTEYVHERIGARTLFATHYHELNELAAQLVRVKNYKVDVREYGDKVVFLHTVTPGTADHSYGIQVAMMAGLPQELTDRAKTILRNLERTELSPHDNQGDNTSGVRAKGAKHSLLQQQGHTGTVQAPQITMFELKDDEIRSIIKRADINSMTPLEALKLLAKLKDQIT
ncbi:MAG TPA: DNA mismatch repair protein MutS [Bacteroidota bacterium]|nr:DNA mismatch repair protein MutS [Bacteroidota bacterium]